MASVRNPEPLRVVLVGGARTRNGLGPFIARFVEQGGGRVVAVVGRDRERARLAAETLSAALGHELGALGDLPAALREMRPDAVVIASPVGSHLPALRAALAAGVHVLCEKPLVAPGETGTVPDLVAGFARAGRMLVENCQMPRLLPYLHQLHPELVGAPLRRLEVGLCPSGTGRAMVEDTLSHFLSFLQALLDGRAVDRVEVAGRSTGEPEARELVLGMRLHAGDAPLEGSLALRQARSQPRPAWLAVNGCRMDRRIEQPGYRQIYHSGNREVLVEDPLQQLVYGFLNLIRSPDLERIREEHRRIRERAARYAEVLDQL